jgi:hypothetical protein
MHVSTTKLAGMTDLISSKEGVVDRGNASELSVFAAGDMATLSENTDVTARTDFHIRLGQARAVLPRIRKRPSQGHARRFERKRQTSCPQSVREKPSRQIAAMGEHSPEFTVG